MKNPHKMTMAPKEPDMTLELSKKFALMIKQSVRHGSKKSFSSSEKRDHPPVTGFRPSRVL